MAAIMTRALFASLLLIVGCGSSDLTVEEDRHRRDLSMPAPEDLATGGGSGGGDMAGAVDLGGGGTGGSGGGTPGSGLFPSTAPWYQDVSNAPKDAQSD